MLERLEAVMASVEKEAAILADERPHLIVLRGPRLGDFFTLEGDALDLGSDPFRADVVVRDIEVEPRHAKIFRDAGGEYVLRDLGTGKGTIVNDEALDSERALGWGQDHSKQLGAGVLPRGSRAGRLPRYLPVFHNALWVLLHAVVIYHSYSELVIASD
jgi:hypothetical protein